MKSRPKTKPVPVKDILKDLLKNFKLEERLGREDIYSLWPRVAGETLARHTWPVAVKGKTLVIGADDSMWMQKLSLMRQELLEAIAGEMGKGAFNELRFIVSSRPSGS